MLNITLFFRFGPEKTQIKSGLWCMCEGGSTLTTAKVIKKLNTNCKSGRLILWDQQSRFQLADPTTSKPHQN